jgi:hypothetical protein
MLKSYGVTLQNEFQENYPLVCFSEISIPATGKKLGALLLCTST